MRPVKLAWHFLIHILTGTAIFVAIGIGYWLLHLFVEWMERQHVSPWAITVLRSVEFFVFCLDTLSFLYFILILGIKFFKELTKELKDG